MMMMMCVEQSLKWELAGETEVLGEKPPPMPLCPQQISRDLTVDRNLATAVGSRWLIAWAMARPSNMLRFFYTVDKPSADIIRYVTQFPQEKSNFIHATSVKNIKLVYTVVFWVL
jgi:hypothetical protein